MNELIKWLTGWQEAAGKAARPLPEKPKPKGPSKSQEALAKAKAAEKRLLAEKKRKEESARTRAAWPRKQKPFAFK